LQLQTFAAAGDIHRAFAADELSSESLLRCWIRGFAMITSTWWQQTNSKLSSKKSKKQPEIRKGKTPKRVQIRPKSEFDSAIVAFS